MEKYKLDLLKKFFNGECTSQEIHEIESWINNDKLKIDQDLSEFSKFFKEDSIEVHSDQIYEQLKDKININESNSHPQGLPPTLTVRKGKNRSSHRIILIAASISIAFFSSWLGYRYHLRTFAAPEEIPVASILKSTTIGQKLTLTLPDGTKVKLNNESSIEYWKDTYETNREVRITGEVFFQVIRDPNRPFRVRTPKEMEVTVLGTSFTVNTTDTQEPEIVAVKSGSVQVENTQDGEKVILDRGDYVTVGNNTPMSKQSYDNEQALFGWVDNQLVFHQTDLKKAFAKVESWYGVTINCEFEPTDYDTFTGSFDNPKLHEILESVCHAFKLNYELENEKKITIY